MTTQLKNTAKSNFHDFPILKKVTMVTSNRDGRVGFVMGFQNNVVTIKMEGIIDLIQIHLDAFQNGFTLSYTKDELFHAVYRIKNLRKQCPRLTNLNDVYQSAVYVNDYLCRFFDEDDVSTLEIYNSLLKLKKIFESK